MLLIGLTAVLSRSKTVQSYLAQKGAQWLSKELGVKVSIDAIEFEFFNNLHIEGLYMEDQARDTLIYVKAMDLEILQFNRDLHLVQFGKATLKSTVLNMGYHKGSENKNINFLIEYLQGPARPKGTPKVIWTIRFASTKLVDCDFHMFDEEKQDTEPGILDQFNLHFANINGDLYDLRIIDDSLHFRAEDLKTVERSGLKIRRMNSVCNMHDKGMDFTELDVYTECSHLEGEIHWSYPGYKKLGDFVSNTVWDARLKQSDVCMGELSIFSPELKDHPGVIRINTVKINGTFDRMKLGAADFRFGNNSRIKGDFFMEGLPDWRTTYCEFEVEYARTNATDLEKLLNGTQLPQMVHDAGDLTAKGFFGGNFLDFKWDGSIQSAMGEATSDVLMNFKPGYSKAIFSGQITSDGLDLSLFSDLLGPSAFDITLDGTGLDPDNFNLNVKADIPRFTLMGREFEQGSIHGKLTSNKFSGKAEIADLRINSDFEGEIRFDKARPEFDFKASSRGLDLYELGLDSLHTLVWGEARVVAAGIKPDDMEGFAELNNMYIHRGGEVFEYSYQRIEKQGIGGNTRITLAGSFATGYLSGAVSLNDIDALAINSMADIFPKKINRLPYSGGDSFEFSVTLHDPALLYSYVMPGLKSNPVHFNGNYYGGRGLAFAELEQMDLEYGPYELKNFEIHTDRRQDSTLKFEASALALYNEGNMQLQNMSVSGSAQHGLAEFNVKLADKTGNYSMDLNAISNVFKDSITIDMLESELKMNEEKWEVDRRSKLVLLNDGTIKVPLLFLDGKDHFVEATGVISARATDTLNVDLGNFSFDFVRPYLKQSALDSLEGRINGKIQVAALLGWPRFSGEINARDLNFYSVHYGDADIFLADIEKSGRLKLDASFSHGVLDGISAMGSIGYKKNSDIQRMSILVEIPENSQLQMIQPFLIDVLTIQGGTIQGQVNISGDFDAPKITGEVKTENAVAFVDYLKTAFRFDADFNANSKGLFTKKPVLIRDETYTGVGLFSLGISHRNFDNFYLDVKVDSARNLRVLNTKEGDDDIYYGTAWADGYCHIYGPFDKISMDVNLKSRKNSNIKLMYSDVDENELLGYVRFIKRDGVKKDSTEERVSNVIHRINITLEVTPDLLAEFIIDKRLGDAIKGRGSGRLKMLFDENENFYLYGTYEVREGDYVYSIPGINLLTKKIALEQGGTIIWSGDPFDAVLNMKGVYEKKISPAALMTAVSGGSQKTYAPIKVQSILYLKGNLMHPDISFDIQAPDLESSSSGSSNDVYQVIQRIRLDKDETMKQAVALMLFGNFITPSFAQNAASAGTGGVVSGTGVAGNSLSSIASSVVNDIFTRMGIPTRIQVNIDDVRSVSGGATRVFVNSEWFLTDRVRLDLNYDPTVAVLVSNVTLPINFNLEYMTRNENWRIRAFSRSSNLLLQQSATTLTTGVAGNTLGAGVVYRREFDTFKPEKKTQDSASRK